jgi:hypothetical protein
MNKKGSVSIFLIIITSILLTSFLVLFQYYSIALLEVDVSRSLSLVNKNILANYEDPIYDNYGILAYQVLKEEALENELMKTFNNFLSPVNMYDLKKVKVDYHTKGMSHYKVLLSQITYFSKTKISLNLAKDIFTRIGKSNLYLEKTKEIQSKLKGNKGYDALKKIHRSFKTGKDSLESFEKNAHSYLEVIEIYENNIEVIENIEIDAVMEDLQEGVDGLRKEYQNSYEKVNLEYKKTNEIVRLKKELEKNKKRLNSVRLDESLAAEEKARQIEKLRNKISSLKIQENNLLKALEVLIKGYEKSNSIKERLSQLKNSIKDVKEVLGYGNIDDYTIEKSEDLFNISFDQSLLLNEYILGTFKSVVKSDYRDFDFYLKNDRNSQSNSEVEYIIKGYQDSVLNTAAVSKDILLIREVMNVAHLLINHKKRAFIFSTAKAPAIGVFAAAGLTGLWATAESSIDLFKIYNGNGTPLLKIAEEDFVLDLGILLEGTSINYSSINRELMMYYQDYLRLLLYQMDDVVKLDRILDLIHTEYTIDSLVLEHSITSKFTFINKFTGNEKVITSTIIGEYIYE